MSELRIEALRLANRHNEPADKIVARADAYFAFLSDGAAPAKTTRKKAEPLAAMEVDTSNPGPTSAPASAPSEPATVDKGKLQKDCMALSNKSGSTALAELFGEFGAAKWSEIAEDKYPALQARLDQLLAPAE